MNGIQKTGIPRLLPGLNLCVNKTRVKILDWRWQRLTAQSGRLRRTFAPPVTRGGSPVCWVNNCPLTGVANLAPVPDEFLRRALV